MNKNISPNIRKYRNLIGCMAIILSLIFLILPPLYYEMESDTKLSNVKALTPHAPIYILQDQDFIGFPGAGTSGNPYRIEGYNITTTSDSSGIMISDLGGSITQHFIIKNCYVDALNYGINIGPLPAGLGKIENVTSTNNNYEGIFVMSCPNFVIKNCSVFNNGMGIVVTDSPNAEITFNEVYNNIQDGIDVSYNSDDSIISNNTCYLNRRGISLDNSNHKIVANNTIHDNSEAGIYELMCPNSEFSNNKLTNDGFFIFETSISNYQTLAFTNNLVNNKELGFFTSTNNLALTLPIYGQFIFIECKNISIENQVIPNTDDAILLRNCENTTISNCIISGCETGIYSSQSNETFIEDNIIASCSKGIYLYNSPRSKIFNTTCSLNSIGIDLSNSQCEIKENFITENSEIGIKISGSSSLPFNITDNEINENQDGVLISNVNHQLQIRNNEVNENSGNALKLVSSSLINVSNNSMNWNNLGMYLENTDNCNFTYNKLKNNNQYGAYIDSNSDNNTFHHNDFIDNNLLSIYTQAHDDGIGNRWFEDVIFEGNYWNDRSELIYEIDGVANAVDPYPLNEPLEPIVYTTQDSIIISNDAELIGYGFPGSGTEEDPYRIGYYNLTAFSTYSIYIENILFTHFVIYNCIVESTSPVGIGLRLIGVNLANLIGNSIMNHGDFGLTIDQSDNITVSRNIFKNNSVGIHIDYSDGCYIYKNYIMNSTVRGLYGYYSDRFYIDNNYVLNNTANGIGFYRCNEWVVINNYFSSNGLVACNIENFCINTIVEYNYFEYNTYAIDTSSCLGGFINNNTFYMNTLSAIRLSSTDDYVIVFNLFDKNGLYGVELSDTSCHDNIIHHNSFFRNNLGGNSQAYSDSSSSIWYDTVLLEGNYWDDWSKIGSYSIAGTANSVDPYPLGIPLNPPIPEYSFRFFVLLMPLFYLIVIVVQRRRKNNLQL